MLPSNVFCKNTFSVAKNKQKTCSFRLKHFQILYVLYVDFTFKLFWDIFKIET